MRAVVCRELARVSELASTMPTPEPSACTVCASGRAAGVNFADSLMLAGRYQEKPSLPFSGPRARGRDRGRRVPAYGAAARAAGTGRGLPRRLRRAGGGARRGRGPAARRHGRRDRRRVRHRLRHGAAPCAGAPACMPGSRSWSTAPAWVGLDRGRMRQGDRCRGDRHGPGRGLAVARDHGADHAVDSEDPDLKVTTRAHRQYRGADVVYDPVGGAVFDASLRAIAWEGRIVIIGFASGQVPQIPANLLLVKNASVVGFYWGSYRKRPGETARQLQRAVRAAPRGKFIRLVSRTCPCRSGRRHPAAGRKACHRQDRGDHAIDASTRPLQACTVAQVRPIPGG